MTAKKTGKKKTAKKKTARKKTAKKPDPKRIGRPPSKVPNTTISFRVPEAAEAGFIELAEKETAKALGRVVKVSEVYNKALAEYAARHGIKIPGWNAASASAA